VNDTHYDIITPREAPTIPAMFRERVRRTPEHCAYRFFDALNGAWVDYSWSALGRDVRRWQAALAAERLKRGDRVAVMARNSRFWVMFDLAAQGLGLVVVPIYTDDRPDNVVYVLEHCGARFLLIGGPSQWERIGGQVSGVGALRRIVSIATLEEPASERVESLPAWLSRGRDEEPGLPELDPDELATIVYTSGTTGHPKGVMLSHRNLLSNAYNSLQTLPLSTQDVMLSFLPLSHTFERTVGYYLPMMAGAVVAHARGIPELPHDLQSVEPHGLIAVPRIFERIHSRIRDTLASQPRWRRRLFDFAVEVGWRRLEHAQGRARWHPMLLAWPWLERRVARRITRRLGGNLKVAVSGGAALSPAVARTFIGLGVPVLQGYGLTEASPVVSVNRIDDNVPESIGRPIPGVEVRIGEDDELLVRGENVMLGFWDDPKETRRVIDADGWLHTGDKARIEDGRIYITGRIKDILVLANGEKVSPGDMELAIAADPLFEHAMIIGEAKPYLAALVALNETHWRRFAREHGLDEAERGGPTVEALLRERIGACLHAFPGYARVYRVACGPGAWTVENGLLTPTLKLRRGQIFETYRHEIERLYEGHEPQR
jgi:long-chain acyl-CoA synthetase